MIKWEILFTTATVVCR